MQGILTRNILPIRTCKYEHFILLFSQRRREKVRSQLETTSIPNKLVDKEQVLEEGPWNVAIAICGLAMANVPLEQHV